jgi:hypothetical protein
MASVGGQIMVGSMTVSEKTIIFENNSTLRAVPSKMDAAQ